MDKPTHLYVDAGPEGLGAILAQKSNVIAYASRMLSDAEQRYSQIEKETFSMLLGNPTFSHVLYSDHLPLVKILENTRIAPNARTEMLLLTIQLYKFCVKHQNGKSNPSDYISRHPIGQGEHNSKVEQYMKFKKQQRMIQPIANYTPKAMTTDEVQEATKNDPTFTRVQESQKRNNCDWKHPELTAFSKIRHELTVKDDIVFRGRNNCDWKHPELTAFSKIRHELTVKDDIVFRGIRIVGTTTVTPKASY
ncbi:RNase H-like domain found in reverse transcriptase [Popillia japonica]|uniref:RNase H-like domain found in reverse transcriptase n=1 Tax=Popillia japonica TaxID=7064 RepID=A0AAW1KRB0_POPJA